MLTLQFLLRPPPRAPTFLPSHHSSSTYPRHDVVEVVGIELECQGVVSPGSPKRQQARVLRVSGNDLIKGKRKDGHNKNNRREVGVGVGVGCRRDLENPPSERKEGASSGGAMYFVCIILASIYNTADRPCFSTLGTVKVRCGACAFRRRSRSRSQSPPCLCRRVGPACPPTETRATLSSSWGSCSFLRSIFTFSLFLETAI